jgi:protein-disulfide isomerase
MHAYLFAHQRALEDQDLRQYAVQLGLDMAYFDRDLAEHTHAGRIQDDIDSGLASGVMGTPTLFINGERFDGSYEFEPLLNVLIHSPQF